MRLWACIHELASQAVGGTANDQWCSQTGQLMAHNRQIDIRSSVCAISHIPWVPCEAQRAQRSPQGKNGEVRNRRSSHKQSGLWVSLMVNASTELWRAFCLSIVSNWNRQFVTVFGSFATSPKGRRGQSTSPMRSGSLMRCVRTVFEPERC